MLSLSRSKWCGGTITQSHLLLLDNHLYLRVISTFSLSLRGLPPSQSRLLVVGTTLPLRRLLLRMFGEDRHHSRASCSSKISVPTLFASSFPFVWGKLAPSQSLLLVICTSPPRISLSSSRPKGVIFRCPQHPERSPSWARKRCLPLGPHRLSSTLRPVHHGKPCW